MDTLKCKYCDKEIQKTTYNRKFCNPNCKQNWHKNIPLKIPKSCPRCKKTFTPTRAWQKYCSTNCWSNSYYYKQKILTPQKLQARNLANKHPFILKKSCNICSSTTNLQKHHSDYKQPFQIEILCAKCHTQKTKGVVNV